MKKEECEVSELFIDEEKDCEDSASDNVSVRDTLHQTQGPGLYCNQMNDSEDESEGRSAEVMEDDIMKEPTILMILPDDVL